ncbi:DUF3006 domain-containing protein [Lachnospiraceae bacterium MD1]|jgi:hypothetical protein|uniref:DUF3006 domain-containing protein n=1 Tax=Variimorphobacter saccharofermentans TaxID=2755051 RepID=A0A839JXH9_9FIRM|nr:DUF3006 domain-containing protein [Variimorphobacter saccharofermentans]MBB2181682.1 DUF3006 domain-containing protein [Variimorphobacter saccharofermentans]
MTKYIIDRFEGNYAICEQEDQKIISIPKYKLPLHCKEGSVLIQDINGMYQIAPEEREKRKRNLKEKMNRLFE